MKKETVTEKELRQDISNSLQNPAEMPDGSRKKWIVLGVLSAVLICIPVVIYPKLLPFLLLSLILFLAIFVGILIYKTHAKRNVRIENYEIVTDVLSYKEEESYTVSGGRLRPRITVRVYTLIFESGKRWRIPDTRNYRWSERNFKWTAQIYDSAEKGNAFVTVVSKKTGDVVLAYSKEDFDCKF